MASCIKCNELYSPKRKALGYKTCLSCGSPTIILPVVPVPKSNYVVGTLAELKQSYNVKGR
jgi:hypothetical protein